MSITHHHQKGTTMMNTATSTIRATCTTCGYTHTLDHLAVHSCQVQFSGGQCEDYPCCGHTDGDGCQTLPSHTAEYWSEGPGARHAGCDHEAGWCDAYDDEDDDEADDDEA